MSGSLQVGFAPQSIAGTWDGTTLTFSQTMAVTAIANFTVSSPSADKKPYLGLAAGYMAADQSLNQPTLPDASCTTPSQTAGSVSMSCTLQSVSGFDPTTNPLYLGANLSIPVGLLGDSYSGQFWVYGKFSPCTGASCGAAPVIEFGHMDAVQVEPVNNPDGSGVVLLPNKSTVVRVFGTASQPTTVNVNLTAPYRTDSITLNQPVTMGPATPNSDNQAASGLFGCANRRPAPRSCALGICPMEPRWSMTFM
ncbi:MAG: hypothetical protein WBL61_19950 [Bryobacteraceae bacterium]